MGSSKVLTSIPNVTPGVSLICAGHPADPGKLPPGVVTVPCHRCGRPVALYRTPAPTSDEPATDFMGGAAPDAALRGANLVEEGTDRTPPRAVTVEIEADPERTPPAPARTETATAEMPAIDITSEELAELDATRQREAVQNPLAPPVPIEESEVVDESDLVGDEDIVSDADESDEPTIRQAVRTPGRPR